MSSEGLSSSDGSRTRYRRSIMTHALSGEGSVARQRFYRNQADPIHFGFLLAICKKTPQSNDLLDGSFEGDRRKACRTGKRSSIATGKPCGRPPIGFSV